MAEIEPGGYLFYDSTRPLPPSKFRDDVHVIGMPLTEISNAVYSDPRQRQLFKNIIYVGALSVLLEMEGDVFEKLFAEQYKGKERLLDSNIRALQLGRDFATEHLQPAGPPGAPLRQGRRPDLRRRQQRRGAGLRLRRRHGGGLVSDHAVLLGARGLPEVLRQVPRRPGHRPQQLRHRAGRGRARLDRHGGGRGLERRARLHRHLRPRHLADDRVHRPGLLRRDPGDHHQRAARRPVHRHAHAHPAVGPDSPAPMPRTATPSTCCCSRRTRTSASSMRPPRWTWPTGCRRRCS